MHRPALSALASVLALTASASALAAPPPAPPPPDSWAGQFLGVAKAMEHDRTCTAHCFALEKLTLTGNATTGELGFELEGGVLADGAFDVPLFGQPGGVRVEHVTLGGAPVLVGFDDQHYFVRTDQRRFTIKGTLTLGADRSLALPGPINVVSSNLDQGHVTEGASLTGVLNRTLHFEATRVETPTAEPTVFELQRSLHVGKRTEFTYRLTLRSGTELGVVRLPLRYGETVLGVSGADGWKVEGGELLLPTAHKSADVTITGELANLSASFSPDPRSPFEWWLLESDPEHRLLVTGDAKQHDSSESPIARIEPSSKLFLVTRGQHLEVTVQSLAGLDVLAGVVQQHSRTLVLTSEGDLVSDDSLSYDNSGIDYLLTSVPGKPIYLATDGASERLLHKDGTTQLMVPLRTGSHTARVQSLAHSDTAKLGGWMTLDGLSFPLTTSHASVTLGLPKNVHALAVTGGDETLWSFDWRDAAALALSLGISLAALRGRRTQALGFAALSGLWFTAPAAFTGLLGVGAVGGVVWLTGRLFEKRARIMVRGGLALAGCVGLLTLAGARPHYEMAPGGGYHADALAAVAPASPTAAPEARRALDDDRSEKSAKLAEDLPMQNGRLGNFAGQLAKDGIVDGVRPVAMPLPYYDHGVTLTRELVTSERPMRLTLVYLTDTALGLLYAAWILSVIGLAWSSRDRLRAWHDAVRTKLAAGPGPAPEAPPAE